MLSFFQKSRSDGALPLLQVIVKTSTQFQLQQKKKSKLYFPNIKKLNINFYNDVSEKAKVMGDDLKKKF